MASALTPRTTRTIKNDFEDIEQNSRSENHFQSDPQKQRQLIILVVIVVGLVAAAYLLFDFKNKRNNTTQSGPKANGEASVEAKNSVPAPAQPASGAQLQVTSATDPAIAALVQTVFKHIFLPSGNVQVANVVKPDELRKVNPVFYQFAKEGDKILIYVDRAILYDPVADKVLDVIHGPSQPVK